MFWKTLMMATPFEVFMYASIVVKLMVLIMLVAGAAAVIAAIARRATNGPRSGLLGVCRMIAFGAAGLAVLYTAMISWMAAQAVHLTRIELLYPEIITVGYVVVLALIVHAIAAFGNAGARRVA